MCACACVCVCVGRVQVRRSAADRQGGGHPARAARGRPRILQAVVRLHRSHSWQRPRAHTHAHARTHAHTHGRARACVLLSTHARMHACTHARTHACTHTHTHAHTMSARARSPTQTHAQRARARWHKYTHTSTHAFVRKHRYRPERMAVIAVGDFADAPAVAAQIRALFSQQPATAAGAATPMLPIGFPAHAEARVRSLRRRRRGSPGADVGAPVPTHLPNASNKQTNK